MLFRSRFAPIAQQPQQEQHFLVDGFRRRPFLESRRLVGRDRPLAAVGGHAVTEMLHDVRQGAMSETCGSVEIGRASCRERV